MCRHFGTHFSVFIGGAYATYEDGTECSETSAYKIQRRGFTQMKEYNIQNMAAV